MQKALRLKLSIVLAALAGSAYLLNTAQATPKSIASVESIAEMQALGTNSAKTPALQVLSYDSGTNKKAEDFSFGYPRIFRSRTVAQFLPPGV